MYRIIREDTAEALGGSKKPSGVFGHKSALHSRPRRYWKLVKAVAKAQTYPKGLYSVRNDSNDVFAVIRNGKVLGVRKAEGASS